MNFLFWPFLWFGLPGRLLTFLGLAMKLPISKMDNHIITEFTPSTEGPIFMNATTSCPFPNTYRRFLGERRSARQQTGAHLHFYVAFRTAGAYIKTFFASTAFWECRFWMQMRIKCKQKNEKCFLLMIPPWGQNVQHKVCAADNGAGCRSPHTVTSYDLRMLRMVGWVGFWWTFFGLGDINDINWHIWPDDVIL